MCSVIIPQCLLSLAINAGRMAFQRLTIFYPHLGKNIRAHESSQPFRSLSTRKKLHRFTFSTTSEYRQETYTQRYGSAAEPQTPPPTIPDNTEKPNTLASAIEKEVKSPRSREEGKKTQQSQTTEPEKETKSPIEKSSEIRSTALQGSTQSIQFDANKSQSSEASLTASREGIAKTTDTILDMTSSSAVQSQEHKAPHLQAPPYVHHFDTFTLVRDLQKGGFSEAQSITLMKAVRSLLAVNLNIARQGLISKSDVENVRFSALPYPASMFPCVPFD